MARMFFSSLTVLVFSLTSVFSQNSYSRSITCYMKYHHGENRAESSNAYLGYSYAQSQITQYVTIDGQPCENVGCTCFSYRKHCSTVEDDATKPNHYSDCNDSDRLNRTIKWYRGWSSLAECEQMRQQTNIYMDLTCCAVSLCNDQPGKVINYVKSPETHAQPVQQNPYYYQYQQQPPLPPPPQPQPQQIQQNPHYYPYQQEPQKSPISSSTLPPRRHEPHSPRSTTTTTQQQRQQQQQPHQVYYYQNTPRDNFDRVRSSPNSASTKFFSFSMQIFAFLFAFLMI